MKYSPFLLSAFLAVSCTALSAQNADAIYTKLDEIPVPVRTISPVAKAGESGLVAILCIVDENGKVINAVVSKSTNAALDEAALAAVQKWDFKPGKKDGKAVKSKITIPVRFEDQA